MATSPHPDTTNLDLDYTEARKRGSCARTHGLVCAAIQAMRAVPPEPAPAGGEDGGDA